MNTYLLTWNPDRWNWEDLAQRANESASDEVIQDRWSCGHTKKIRKGDRIFLVRLGVEPKGIIAAGWAISEPHLAAHWDQSRSHEGLKALYVDCAWERLLNPNVDKPLALPKLKSDTTGTFSWTPQSSGIQIPQPIAEKLEQMWAEHVGESTLGLVSADDEISEFEGEERLSLVRHRRREQKLRRAKISKALNDGDGRLCCEVPGCGFDFHAVYGELGKDFAFVHHLKPLSDRVAPTATLLSDLAIVCGNCHAMIHRGGECRPLARLISKN